jgi:hypothetical protein
MTDFLARWAAAAGPADPPGFQLLFPDLLDLSADAVAAAVRDYHPDLAAATVELVPTAALPADADLVRGDGPPAVVVGLVGWGEHAVKLLGFDAPMPADAVEPCLRPALLPDEMKAVARGHRAHVLLYYAGRAADPIERRTAVGAVAGPLARFGAVVTLNEEAQAAVPAFALLPDDLGEDMLATLRSLPIPYLYGGFVRFAVTGEAGLWVRTVACHRLGLPDLAYRMGGPDAGERVFHLFAGVLGYLRQTGLAFEPGETVRVDEDTHLAVREPTLAEWWLDSPGRVWVLEDA